MIWPTLNPDAFKVCPMLDSSTAQKMKNAVCWTAAQLTNKDLVVYTAGTVCNKGEY